MALSSLRRRLLRALGIRLRAWSDAALRRAGDPAPAIPAEPATSAPARSGPPEHWLARARLPAPPAHWLARIRRAQAELGSAARFAGEATPEVPAHVAPAAHEMPQTAAAAPAAQAPATPPAPTAPRARAREGRTAVRLQPASPRASQSPPAPPPPSGETLPDMPLPAAPRAEGLRPRAAVHVITRPARLQAEEDSAAVAQPTRAPRRGTTAGASPLSHDARAAGPAAITVPLMSPARARSEVRAAGALRAPESIAPDDIMSPEPDDGRLDGVVRARESDAGRLGGAVPAPPARRASGDVSAAALVPASAQVESVTAVEAAPRSEPAAVPHGDMPRRAEALWPPWPVERPAAERARGPRLPRSAARPAARRHPAPAGRWPELPGGNRSPAGDEALESLRAQARLERLDREQRGR